MSSTYNTEYDTDIFRHYIAYLVATNRISQ